MSHFQMLCPALPRAMLLQPRKRNIIMLHHKSTTFYRKIIGKYKKWDSSFRFMSHHSFAAG
jgi:hypothetical protein